MKPEITKTGIFDMQICIPESYTDEQAETFANSESPAGTENGWVMKHAGNESLNGDAERVKCQGRAGCVHIMLEC